MQLFEQKWRYFLNESEEERNKNASSQDLEKVERVESKITKILQQAPSNLKKRLFDIFEEIKDDPDYYEDFYEEPESEDESFSDLVYSIGFIYLDDVIGDLRSSDISLYGEGFTDLRTVFGNIDKELQHL